MINFKAAKEIALDHINANYQKPISDVVAKLRDPVKGCPWDLAQTPESLNPYRWNSKGI